MERHVIRGSGKIEPLCLPTTTSVWLDNGKIKPAPYDDRNKKVAAQNVPERERGVQIIEFRKRLTLKSVEIASKPVRYGLKV